MPKTKRVMESLTNTNLVGTIQCCSVIPISVVVKAMFTVMTTVILKKVE